ncbi:MAG: hypothetical protein NDI62_01745 [Burkholderiales bacterium]|nr:hypothetical protein [Burkholderiales bacterium]
MKTVEQIYSEYKINSGLQLHQLRTGAVAKIICDNFKGDLDKKSIILACLFHDMGNIIKFDLNFSPELLEPEGVEYWQKIRGEFIEKYGESEHVATEIIAEEIGLPKEVIDHIKSIGFSNAIKNNLSSSYENKICNYSDMRVSPLGVLPFRERALEGRKRYLARKDNHAIASDNFEELFSSMENIEKQIFVKTKIKPEEITEESIQEIMKELRNLTI